MEQIAARTHCPVQEEDEALLLELHSSTGTDEMAPVSWDAAQKRTFLRHQFSARQKHYQAYFPQATHDMILAEGQHIGQLLVDHRETEIRVLAITLLSQARGRGIATLTLLDLMKEARHENKSCSIYVESFNRSLDLFQRLEFVKTEENGAAWLMEWRAAS
jgi:hypothetical protein